MSDLRSGDVVRLKGLCVPMTLTRVDESGLHWCRWFVGAQLHEVPFLRDSLTRVDPLVNPQPYHAASPENVA